MARISKIGICTFIFLVVFPVLGNAQVVSKDPQDLFVEGTESLNFTSKINSTEYKLYVNLPQSYADNPTKTYPVFTY